MQSSEATAHQIRANWLRVQQDVSDACRECGRDPSSVQVVGVSKYVDPPFAAQLVQAGCTLLGENRPQHLWSAAEYFQAENIQYENSTAQWHMIGHLQRNKIRRTLPLLSCLHSLDSERLARAIHEDLESRDATLRVMVEVNVTQDTQKTGLPTAELAPFLEMLASLPRLNVCGLMAMSTLGATGDQTRREFERVRELLETQQANVPGTHELTQLSMGMSGDFREAIMAGSTHVRIGTRLWDGILQ